MTNASDLTRKVVMEQQKTPPLPSCTSLFILTYALFYFSINCFSSIKSSVTNIHYSLCHGPASSTEPLVVCHNLVRWTDSGPAWLGPLSVK